MKDLIWLIPFLPLLGFLILGIGNKRIPRAVAGWLASLAVLGSFIISLGLFSQLNDPSQAFTLTLFEWFSAGDLRISLEFLVDRLSVLMLLVITGVGFLIHMYSIGYMSHEEDYSRYFCYLNLFVFFMLLLVLGNNFIVMFAGWEGVGLCSYLLIGFWFKNSEFNDAAKKAFIMNRIGDLGFLLGVFLIFMTFGSVSFSAVFEGAALMNVGDPVIVAITLLLFIGAMGKSAQIPLYTWLPDAMAGPTPVSALIHAATMVTAGIYMIVRTNVLYTLAPITMEFVAVVGLATAFLAATIGLFQNDIKKVLAYSTVSQLGFMFVAIGVGAFGTAMFHLITHAFFKALLFLGAGSVIHAMSDEQDIRFMGGLKKFMPVTHITFLAATVAIAGLPPFAGFFSKDEILASVFGHNVIMFVVLAVTSLLTAVYMFRLYYLTFHGKFRGSAEQESHLHESPAVMTIPLIVLAVLSTIGGFIGIPEIFHMPHWLSGFLAGIVPAPEHHVSHTFEMILIISSVVIILAVLFWAAKHYTKSENVPAEDDAEMGSFAKLCYNKYYVDEMYEKLITGPLQSISNFLHDILEVRVIDNIVNGFGRTINNASTALRLLQTGNVGFYIFGMVLSIIFFVALGYFLI
ncbi:MAG: NADH-quinone oxidoreductase subunit L [Bacteroidia bacterium]|nr:NADH-quinone oxidoreductase subunit L [Bacteroidia bacterium]